jgi:hypothetical protein
VTAGPGNGPVLLVSSSGGVLLELIALRPWWSRHEVIWAACRASDTEPLLADLAAGQQQVYWVPEISARRPAGLVPGLWRALAILRRHRPGLLVSAGTGLAVPFFLAARLRGVPSFWVATLNVVDQPGIAARICARLASRVLVQRPEQLAGHPGAVVIGELY